MSELAELCDRCRYFTAKDGSIFCANCNDVLREQRAVENAALLLATLKAVRNDLPTETRIVVDAAIEQVEREI